ncbi:helix-turn-helix transcriptional regulator [Planctomycetota bacterium]
MFRLITMLQSGHPYICDNLAKTLKISRRTVFRDLAKLREAGIPCEYDKKKHCCCIKQDFFLPPANLNKLEALGLLLLAFKGINHLNLPFKNSITHAALKVQNNLPPKMKRYCNTIFRCISIKADPQPVGYPLNRIFEQLLTAILRKRLVHICCYLPDIRRSIVTNLSPYHLIQADHKWHVIGKSSFHKAYYFFELSRISELNILKKCYIDDKNFDINDYISKAWALKPEGTLYNVKLRLLPEIARSVAEVKWHSTQAVEFKPDGSAIIEFRIDGLNEVIWWILSYGDKVQILAPQVLRKKIAQIASNLCKLNK